MDQRRRASGLRQDHGAADAGSGAGRRDLGQRSGHHPAARPAPLLSRPARNRDGSLGLARGCPAARPRGPVPVAGRRRRRRRRVRRRRRGDDGGDDRSTRAHHVQLARSAPRSPSGPARAVPDARAARAAGGAGGRPVLPVRDRCRRTSRRPRGVRRGRPDAAACQRWAAAADRADGGADRTGRHDPGDAERVPVGSRPRVVRAARGGPAALLPPALDLDRPGQPGGARRNHGGRHRHRARARPRAGATLPRGGVARRPDRHAGADPPPRGLPDGLDR